MLTASVVNEGLQRNQRKCNASRATPIQGGCCFVDLELSTTERSNRFQEKPKHFSLRVPKYELPYLGDILTHWGRGLQPGSGVVLSSAAAALSRKTREL